MYCAGRTLNGLRVAWVGPLFLARFKNVVEEDIPAIDMAEYRLQVSSSLEPPIIAELGGVDHVKTSLGQFWAYLLSADRKVTHVRHVADPGGTLLSVGARWYGDGLSVEARLPLEDRLGRLASDRFISDWAP